MKRSQREIPELNTSSLPDIIFMLLFFFMVVTVLRTSKVNVEIDLPSISSGEKIKHQSYTNYIYVGQDRRDSSKTVIQLNDAFVQLSQLERAIKSLDSKYTDKLSTLRSNSLKVDENVKMGIVNEIKLRLRKAESLKLNYVINDLVEK